MLILLFDSISSISLINLAEYEYKRIAKFE